MSGAFTFNGHTSTEFGLMISGFKAFNAPKRIYDKFSVPGRNGDLLIDTGTYENIQVEYEASMVNFTPEKADAVRVWLLGSGGYIRLEDTYNPDYFRLARFAGPVEWTDFTQLLRHSHVNLQFDCKPQRFLYDGDSFENITSLTEFINPTIFKSVPQIKAVMQSNIAELRIGDCTISFIDLDGKTIYLDAETCDAIDSNGTNLNENIKIYGELVLPPGNIPVQTPGLSSCEIRPRWWTL